MIIVELFCKILYAFIFYVNYGTNLSTDTTGRFTANYGSLRAPIIGCVQTIPKKRHCLRNAAQYCVLHASAFHFKSSLNGHCLPRGTENSRVCVVNRVWLENKVKGEI